MGRKYNEDREPLLPDQPVKGKKGKGNIFRQVVDQLRFRHKGYKRQKDEPKSDGMQEYYMRQAGNDIGGFSGIRYQKGDGFMGRMVSGAILPLIKKVLPFLGTTALSTGMNIVSDLQQGQKFKESAKRRLKESAGVVGDKAMAKVRALTGTGRRRRRRTKRSRPLKPARTKSRQKKTPRRRKKRRSKKNFASPFL